MIRTKAQFITLSENGQLGNALRVWQTQEGLQSSVEQGYTGYVTLRARVKQSPFLYPWCHVLPEHDGREGHPSVDRALRSIEAQSAKNGDPLDVTDFYFTEVPPPTAQRRLNFEAGWIGHHEFVAYLEPQTTEPVRGIRERIEPVTGARAQLLLKTYLLPQSYETLQALWDLYPDAIMEATEYSQACGVLHQNLVVWEVRHY